MILQPNCSTIQGKLPSDTEREAEDKKKYLKEHYKEVEEEELKLKDEFKALSNVELKKRIEEQLESDWQDSIEEPYESVNIDTSSYPNSALQQLLGLLEDGSITDMDDLEWENVGGGGHYDYVEKVFELATKIYKEELDLEEAEKIEETIWEHNDVDLDGIVAIKNLIFKSDLVHDDLVKLKKDHGDRIIPVIEDHMKREIKFKDKEIPENNKQIIKDWLIAEML